MYCCKQTHWKAPSLHRCFLYFLIEALYQPTFRRSLTASCILTPLSASNSDFHALWVKREKS